MSRQSWPLDRSRCLEYVRAHHTCAPSSPAGTVAATVEWVVKDALRTDDRGRPIADPDTRERISRLLDTLPGRDADAEPIFDARGSGLVRLGRGTLGFTSGGQMRYQSPAVTDPGPLSAELRLHVGGLVHRLQQAGLRSVFQGIDPFHGANDVPLQLTNLRQRLMESYLEETSGEHGALMMRCSSALMINVHPGEGEDAAHRLEATARLAPVMAAIFANSPLRDEQPSGWVSRRLHHHALMDSRRTQPIPWSAASDPAAAIVDYALDAPVMLKDDGFGGVAVLSGSPTFGDWLAGDHPQGAPTLLDWRAHLSTLFPPVWRRGFIEIRVHDTQAPQWLPVPIALWWALLWRTDPRLWCETGALPDVDYETVATRGIRNPDIVMAAHRIYDHALAVLESQGGPAVPASLLHLVKLFRQTYLDRGRMPADDLIDRTRNTPTTPQRMMGDNTPA